MTELATVSNGELKADVKFEKGKVVLSTVYDGKGADAKVEVSIESDYFLDKLAAAIPGQIDDTVIALLKGALKA